MCFWYCLISFVSSIIDQNATAEQWDIYVMTVTSCYQFFHMLKYYFKKLKTLTDKNLSYGIIIPACVYTVKLLYIFVISSNAKSQYFTGIILMQNTLALTWATLLQSVYSTSARLTELSPSFVFVSLST